MMLRACCLAVSVSIFAVFPVVGAASGQASQGAAKTYKATSAAPSGPKAFPEAAGWAAWTPGGRGGEIIRVTNLDASGPGSLKAAIETKGPRIIVFEVGGVIDLGAKMLTIHEPNVTIAGQTAPSPGITLIRGGLDIGAHDVVVQHIRIRPGTAGGSYRKGPDFDAVSTITGAYNVIVDHCSLTWGTDENMSASGGRFTGSTPEEWRKGASHDITFSNNIAAEGLAVAVHAKGEHSKGSLIHDNATNILIYQNLYAHNMERNPLFKGGVHGVVVNNLIYNPGWKALHYNLMANEWAGYTPVNGQMTAVGNVLRGGFNTAPGIRFLMIGGIGDLDYFGADNIMQDKWGDPIAETGKYEAGTAKIVRHKAPLDWPAGLKAMPANQVETYVLTHVGARPWDRDAHDVRLLADVAESRGEIINDEYHVGGYPVQEETHRPFDASKWNLDDMSPKDPSVLDSSHKAKGT
ncbi:MAG TPA: pectate lyase [Hyphomonadaceae bacterium]|nr:pectate lyase [Hyphomonadaceae bacterium]